MRVGLPDLVVKTIIIVFIESFVGHNPILELGVAES